MDGILEMSGDIAFPLACFVSSFRTLEFYIYLQGPASAAGSLPFKVIAADLDKNVGN